MRIPWQLRYVTRPLGKAFASIKEKELRWDQRRLAYGLAARLGKKPYEIEALVFEVGAAYLIGVGIGRIQDTLGVMDKEGVAELAKTAGVAFQAGLKKP